MQVDYPQVSVIMPVRNEARFIGECLSRLVSQTYPKDRTEILVIDGMSEDGTRDIVVHELEKANRELGVVLRLLDNFKRQRASGLNIGIKNARGNVFIRVDARTVILENYIEKCVQTLIETHADNVGGIQVPLVANNSDRRKKLTQRAIGIALSHPFGIGNAQFRLGKRSGYVDTVYLGCFRKEVFDKVGLFDEDAAVIGEDTDMNYRIRKAGGKVYLNNDIIAYYHPRDRLKDLWRLYFRYGGARAGNFLKTRAFTSWRQIVPLAFICALGVTAIGSLVSTTFSYLFVSLALVYLVADCAVSIYLSLRHAQPSFLFTLLVVFPCIHCAWAFGFFRRLFQRPKPGQYWGY